jgi:hypothetical protein
MRVQRRHQADFLCPRAGLDLLFTPNSLPDVFENLIVDKLLSSVSGCKARDYSLAMLINALD